jgi:hypothetical protein
MAIASCRWASLEIQFYGSPHVPAANRLTGLKIGFRTKLEQLEAAFPKSLLMAFSTHISEGVLVDGVSCRVALAGG